MKMSRKKILVTKVLFFFTKKKKKERAKPENKNQPQGSFTASLWRLHLTWRTLLQGENVYHRDKSGAVLETYFDKWNIYVGVLWGLGMSRDASVHSISDKPGSLFDFCLDMVALILSSYLSSGMFSQTCVIKTPWILCFNSQYKLHRYKFCKTINCFLSMSEFVVNYTNDLLFSDVSSDM